MKFIILTRCRTGSNLLVRSLNQHPDISCEGEILKQDDIQDPFTGRTLWRGFKLFYCHWKYPEIRESLHNDRDLYLIHLTRRDIFSAILSRHLACKTGAWLKKDYGETKIKLKPDELRRCITKSKQHIREGTRSFKTERIHTLDYEDLSRNLQRACDGIFEFFNLDSQEIETPLKKQRDRDVLSYIENREEVTRLLKEEGLMS